MYLIDSFGRNIQTFDETIKKFEEAKSWLESKGIRVNSSRFQKNKKLLLKNSPSTTDQDFELLWANAELHDLSEIHSYLSNIDSSNLTDSLRKIVKGPVLLAQEKKDGGSIHGRNFSFELYTASRLAKAGYDVTFDTDADINFIKSEVLFHVECKRVISENNMDSLIEKAIKQIDKRCSDNDRGIVAVSVSKLVYKAIQIGAKGSHADLEEMQEVMRPMVGKWSQLIQHHYSQRSSNVVGLILHYKMPLRDQKTGAAAFLNRFAMVPFNNGNENNILAYGISESLRSSVEGLS